MSQLSNPGGDEERVEPEASVSRLPIEIRLCLRAGTVYYFCDREVRSPEPHYFVVINRSPVEDGIILLAILTSKVDRAMARNIDNPGAVVVISRSEYSPPLECDSAIECTHLFRRTPQEIVDKMARNEIGYFQPDLPRGLLNRIRRALLASEAISDHEKALIFSPSELASGQVE